MKTIRLLLVSAAIGGDVLGLLVGASAAAAQASPYESAASALEARYEATAIHLSDLALDLERDAARSGVGLETTKRAERELMALERGLRDVGDEGSRAVADARQSAWRALGRLRRALVPADPKVGGPPRPSTLSFPAAAASRCEDAPVLAPGTYSEAYGRSRWLRLPLGGKTSWQVRAGAAAGSVDLEVRRDCGRSAAPLASASGAFGRMTEAVLRASDEGVWLAVRPAAGSRDVWLAVAPLSGQISGHVQDAATGLPLTSAAVEVFDAFGHQVRFVYTDPQGAYEVTVPSPGIYYARAEGYSTDYLAQVWQGHECGVLYCDPVASGDAISVASGGKEKDIDFALTRASYLRGRVTDARTGLPIAHAYVRVFDSLGRYRGESWTLGDGTYTSNRLDLGTYFIEAERGSYQSEVYLGMPCGAQCDPLHGTPIPLPAATTIDGIDFSLEPLGSISGRVFDATSGDPIPWAKVAFFRAGEYYAQSADTDAMGRFTSPGLLPADYHLWAWGDPTHQGIALGGKHCDGGGWYCSFDCDLAGTTTVAVRGGESTAGIEFPLPLRGAVAGTVTASGGGPVPMPTRIEVRAPDSCLISSADVAADGSYSVPNIPTRDVRASALPAKPFWAELWQGTHCDPGGYCNPALGSPIAVHSPATASGIDFALERGGEVAGHVYESGGLSPASGVTVCARPVASWSSCATTGADGAYSIAPLPTGDVRLWASGDSSALRPEVWNDQPCLASGCDVAAGDAVAVVDGASTSTIDFVLDHLGSISGHLSWLDLGVPHSAYSYANAWSSRSVTAAWTTSTTDTYRLDRLYPGSYYVTASPTWYDYSGSLWPNLPCWMNYCDVTAGTPVVVGVGSEVTGIDLTFGMGRGVSGVVRRREDGTPLANVGIDIWDANGHHVSVGRSRANGSYFVPADAATYFVSTDNNLGRIDELFADVECPNGSAWLGLCDPRSGQGMTVFNAASPGGVDFDLATRMLEDGFELGSVTAWSSTGP